MSGPTIFGVYPSDREALANLRRAAESAERALMSGDESHREEALKLLRLAQGGWTWCPSCGAHESEACDCTFQEFVS